MCAKCSSLIGPFDNTDFSLCCVLCYESNSKICVGSISLVSETSIQDFKSPDYRPSPCTNLVWNLGYLTGICSKSRWGSLLSSKFILKWGQATWSLARRLCSAVTWTAIESRPRSSQWSTVDSTVPRPDVGLREPKPQWAYLIWKHLSEQEELPVGSRRMGFQSRGQTSLSLMVYYMSSHSVSASLILDLALCLSFTLLSLTDPFPHLWHP